MFRSNIGIVYTLTTHQSHRCHIRDLFEHLVLLNSWYPDSLESISIEKLLPSDLPRLLNTQPGVYIPFEIRFICPIATYSDAFDALQYCENERRRFITSLYTCLSDRTPREARSIEDAMRIRANVVGSDVILRWETSLNAPDLRTLTLLNLNRSFGETQAEGFGIQIGKDYHVLHIERPDVYLDALAARMKKENVQEMVAIRDLAKKRPK